MCWVDRWGWFLGRWMYRKIAVELLCVETGGYLSWLNGTPAKNFLSGLVCLIALHQRNLKHTVRFCFLSESPGLGGNTVLSLGSFTLARTPYITLQVLQKAESTCNHYTTFCSLFYGFLPCQTEGFQTWWSLI